MRSSSRTTSTDLLAGVSLSLGCANFSKLRTDLDFMSRTYVVSVGLENAEASPNLRGLVVEWDRQQGKVLSFDRANVGSLGVFGFFVKSAENQYVMAFS